MKVKEVADEKQGIYFSWCGLSEQDGNTQIDLYASMVAIDWQQHAPTVYFMHQSVNTLITSLRMLI